jgi:predicted phage-related endonuclease
MTRQIDIPENMLFDGTLPPGAADVVLSQLETAEKEIPEWKRKRIGKITASEFCNIKKLKTSGDWGETALSYLYDLVGEHLTGQPSEDFEGNKATKWGNLYEADALKAYTKRTGRKVKPGEFLQHPTLNWVGGTPDGLVGEQGMVEAKCPFSFKNHLRTVITRTVPDEYLPQVLGHLWLSGREWCDFVSYDPRIKGVHGLAIVRVERAKHLTGIAALAERVTEFHELLLNKLAALKVKPGKMIQQ